MKKLILIFGALMLFVFTINAQSVSGKYGNAQSTWEFIDTEESQEYDYRGYDRHGKLISKGYAVYSIGQKRFVVIFKRLDLKDSIGFAVCEYNAGTITVKTLNPDGTVRWNGGTMTKK